MLFKIQTELLVVVVLWLTFIFFPYKDNAVVP